MTKVSLYKIFYLLIFFVFTQSVKGNNYVYLQQKSLISGLVDVYFDDKILALNFVDLKIWVFAKASSEYITVVNMKDKLYIEELAIYYRGNYAQRSVLAVYDHLNTSKWKFVSNAKHFDQFCSTYTKFNLSPDNLIQKNLDNNNSQYSLQKRLTIIPKNKLNYKQISCVVCDKYKLSSNQCRAISRVFGLIDMQYLPLSSVISHSNGSFENLLVNLHTGFKDVNLNKLVNYSKFNKVKMELKVYDFNSNLSNQIKDLLEMP